MINARRITAVLISLGFAAALVGANAAEARKRGREGGSTGDAARIDESGTSALLRELGADFEVHHTAHYRIAHDTGAQYAELHGVLFEAVYRAFHEFFQASGFRLREPGGRLDGVIFADRTAFGAYARKSHPKIENAGGFYSSANNRIALFNSFSDADYERMVRSIETAETSLRHVRKQVAESNAARLTLKSSDGSREELTREQALARLRTEQRSLRAKRRQLDGHFGDLNLTTTIHECVHQLSYNLGVQSLSADNPKWLSEGLATYFETVGYRDVGPSGNRNPQRFKSYREAQQGGRLIRLRDLLTRDELFDVSKSAATTAYGQSWALVHFLLDTHAEQFFSYLHRVARTGHASSERAATRLKMFEDAFGQDIATTEKRWHAYMATL